MSDVFDRDWAMAQEARELRANGRYPEAIELFTRLLNKYDVSELYFERGSCYSKHGELRNAISDFTRAIALKNEDPDCFVNRGNAYLKQKQYAEAIKDYNEALRLSPGIAQAYNSRAYAYQMLGRADDAVRDFLYASELDTSYASPCFNLGALLFDIGKVDDALAFLNRANELLPNDAAALVVRGDVHSALGAFEAALGDYEKALQLDPSYFPGLLGMAWLLSTCPVEHFRNGKQAIIISEELCREGNTRNVLLLQVLAAANAECGNFTEAVRWQEQALVQAPAKSQPLILERLSLLRERIPIRCRGPVA
jgi:tetratricopeptide (TPR) repeat protein